LDHDHKIKDSTIYEIDAFGKKRPLKYLANYRFTGYKPAITIGDYHYSEEEQSLTIGKRKIPLTQKGRSSEEYISPKEKYIIIHELNKDKKNANAIKSFRSKTRQVGA
jgi:hypothetical protein